MSCRADKISSARHVQLKEMNFPRVELARAKFDVFDHVSILKR